MAQPVCVCEGGVFEYDLDDKPEVGDAAVFGCCCIPPYAFVDLFARSFTSHTSLSTRPPSRGSLLWLTMADYGLLWYMRPRPPSLPRSSSQVAAKNATLFELHTELNILTGKPLQGLDQYDDVRAYAPVSDRGPSVAGVRSGGFA